MSRRVFRQPWPTPYQRDMLAFIAKFIEANGCAPTVREIMTGMGYRSTGAVAEMLGRIEARGLIARGDVVHSRRAWRSIALAPVDNSKQNKIAVAA